MRLRHSLLAATLVAGSATVTAAQDPNPEPRPERRSWTWVEPDFYRFRMSPDRMRIVERALERSERARSVALERARTQIERAARIRDRVRARSFAELDRRRDREFELRNRRSDQLHENLRLDRRVRERTMERVRERMERLRDDHRYVIRRRSRII